MADRDWGAGADIKELDALVGGVGNRQELAVGAKVQGVGGVVFPVDRRNFRGGGKS